MKFWPAYFMALLAILMVFDAILTAYGLPSVLAKKGHSMETQLQNLSRTWRSYAANYILEVSINDTDLHGSKALLLQASSQLWIASK